MMIHSTSQKIDAFEIEINDVNRNFQFKVEVKLKGKHCYHLLTPTMSLFSAFARHQNE